MLDQDKQNLIKSELVALNHGMTEAEYEKYLKDNAGSVAFEKAVRKFKSN